MKAKERHDLHTNALAEWLSVTGEKLRPYSGLITAGLIAVAILAAIVAYMRGASQRGAAAAASDQLIAAMDMGGQALAELQATVRDYPGTSQAAVAQLLLAEALLDSGSTTLYHNKPAGATIFPRRWQCSTTCSAPAATRCCAPGRSTESDGPRNRWEIWIKQKLLTGNWRKITRIAALAGPLRQHLARLNQPATKEFYDWFAAQNPQPPKADTGPGVPGLKPSFDLKDSAIAGRRQVAQRRGAGHARREV